MEVTYGTANLLWLKNIICDYFDTFLTSPYVYMLDILSTTSCCSADYSLCLCVHSFKHA